MDVSLLLILIILFAALTVAWSISAARKFLKKRPRESLMVYEELVNKQRHAQTVEDENAHEAR